MQLDDIEEPRGSFHIPLARRERPAAPEAQIVADIEGFADALSEKSTQGAQAFVDGARLGFYGAHEWMRYWGHRIRGSRVRVDAVRLKYLQGDEARVDVSYALFGRYRRDFFWPEDWVTREESFKMRLREVRLPSFGGPHTQTLWGIVWEEDAGWAEHGLGSEQWNRDPYSLRKAAFFLGQPPGVASLIRAEESVHRLSALQHAVRAVAEIYGAYAFEPEFLREALSGFVPGARCFRVPSLTEEYSFNTRLCGLSTRDIAEPERTILFYEGQGEQLAFRYNDKAALCTVGSGMMPRSREEAAALKWEP